MIENFSEKYYEQVIQLWNENLTHEAISEERFNEIILSDVNYSDKLSKVAIVNNKVVGYIYATKRIYSYLDRGREPERGFINIIVVDKNHRRKGIGTSLLKTVEKELIELGSSRITVGAYSPNYFFPGVEEHLHKEALDFFEKNKYEIIGNAVSMEMSLANYEYPQKIVKQKNKLNKEGYRFRNFQNSDTSSLLKFLEKEFGSGWKFNALEIIRAHLGKEQIIICENKEKEIVGMTLRGIDKNPGRFGPFGVAEGSRNAGLGSVLFHETMMNMKKENTMYCYFLWTGGDAQRFYERQGMKVFRNYKLVEKNI